MEVWLFDLYAQGASVEVKRFPSKEEADLYVDAARAGRNVVFVRDADERDKVWRMIGAKVTS